MGLRPLEIFLLLQRGDRLWSSESDVYRRQILSTKVDPRAVRVEDIINFIISLQMIKYMRHMKIFSYKHECMRQTVKFTLS